MKKISVLSFVVALLAGLAIESSANQTLQQLTPVTLEIFDAKANLWKPKTGVTFEIADSGAYRDYVNPVNAYGKDDFAVYASGLWNNHTNRPVQLMSSDSLFKFGGLRAKGVLLERVDATYPPQKSILPVNLDAGPARRSYVAIANRVPEVTRGLFWEGMDVQGTFFFSIGRNLSRLVMPVAKLAIYR